MYDLIRLLLNKIIQNMQTDNSSCVIALCQTSNVINSY